MLLLGCTALSLILSNAGTGAWYRGIWNNEIHYPSVINLPHTPLKWINDFLMAIFFLFAGMEIKRELTIGELSSFKKAIIPFGAALGGMIVPALIYSSFNITSDIPMDGEYLLQLTLHFQLVLLPCLVKRYRRVLKYF